MLVLFMVKFMPMVLEKVINTCVIDFKINKILNISAKLREKIDFVL